MLDGVRLWYWPPSVAPRTLLAPGVTTLVAMKPLSPVRAAFLTVLTFSFAIFGPLLLFDPLAPGGLLSPTGSWAFSELSPVPCEFVYMTVKASVRSLAIRLSISHEA